MKGIMFSKEMFDATVNGTKTQTRRIVKPQPCSFWLDVPMKKTGKVSEVAGFSMMATGVTKIKPRYKVGETVYIKEPFVVAGGRKENPNGTVAFKWRPNVIFPNGQQPDRWENPRTMAATQARHFIEITGVRCERAQDISDEDCLKEGVKSAYYFKDLCKIPESQIGRDVIVYFTGIDEIDDKVSGWGNMCKPHWAYNRIFDKIYGEGSFEKNPYVFAYDFRLKHKSFDEILDYNKEVLIRLKDK